jgi:hypothetical protein
VTRDLDTLLRDADPLRTRPGDDVSLLATVRERIDRDREPVSSPHGRRMTWPRRIGLAAAAAAVLTAVPLVLSAVLPDDAGLQQHVVPAAVAGDGTIDCGTGFAAVIDPADADPRLLPDQVPHGWRLTEVFARESSTTGWCIPPSLAVLQFGPDEVVSGTLRVIGPIQAVIDDRSMGGSTPDTVDGHAARLFTAADGGPLNRWIWTDDHGQQWEAESDGASLEQARTALAAVATSGSRISWSPARAAGWTAVHVRTGAPYSTHRQGLEWYMRFDGHGREQMLEVDRDGGPTVPLAARAQVGSRLTTLGGRPAVISPGDGVPAATAVQVEVGPGTTAWGRAAGDDLADLADLTTMLTSLRDVQRDDPQLARYGTD